jgi:hypothetical protein
LFCAFLKRKSVKPCKGEDNSVKLIVYSGAKISELFFCVNLNLDSINTYLVVTKMVRYDSFL